MRSLLRIAVLVLLGSVSASAGDEQSKRNGETVLPNWVQSSVYFTRGTEALDAKRYDDAVSYLEKAVALDPTLSRNQNNLAAAYFAVGRVRDGWPHVREAANLDPTDASAKKNFLRYFAAMKDLTDLQTGDSYETVRKKLGPADQMFEQPDRVWWRYGHTALEFKGGHLSGAADMGVSK